MVTSLTVQLGRTALFVPKRDHRVQSRRLVRGPDPKEYTYRNRNDKPKTAAQSGTDVGRFGKIIRHAKDTIQPNDIPISPPSPVRTTASVRNWSTISFLRAPIAFRTPISAFAQ